MANISKYTRAHLPALFAHNNRKAGSVDTLSNKEIDKERTALNYNFVENTPAFVAERLKHFYHEDRKNLVVLGEVTLTLPKDVRSEDSSLFFETAYHFFCKDFGVPNVVNAVVHLDETTPHMHLDFLPVKPLEADMTAFLRLRVDNYIKEHGPIEGRLCAREVLNRPYYQHMHPRLLDVMTKVLGYECEILNGSTDTGNRTVLQMKNERLALELEAKQKQVSTLAEKMNYLTSQIEKAGFDKRYFSAPEIFVKLDALEKENGLLRKVITTNGLVIPQDSFRALTDMKKAFGEQRFYITEQDFEEQDGIRVIETYRRKPRIMPEWQYIERDRELEWIVNSGPVDLTLFNNVLLFPTDDIGDTARNLMYIKEHEAEYKKLLFPQISNDIYNLAESLLRQCRFETLYKLQNRDVDIERRIEIAR